MRVLYVADEGGFSSASTTPTGASGRGTGSPTRRGGAAGVQRLPWRPARLLVSQLRPEQGQQHVPP